MPGGCISRKPERTAPRRQGERGARLYRNFGTNGRKQEENKLLSPIENQKSQVIEFSSFLCMGRCNSLASLRSLSGGTSVIWGQDAVFPHPGFPLSSASGVASVSWLLDGRFSFPPEFPRGSPVHHQRWLLLWWPLLLTVTSFVY